jgi:hypothetical protein
MRPALVPLPSVARAKTRCTVASGCRCALFVVALAGALGACSSVGVKPWDRDLMARPDMAPDPAPIDSAIDDHIYFSKEASTGGRGFGGGGCGCN